MASQAELLRSVLTTSFIFSFIHRTSIKKRIKKFGQYLSTPYVLHTNDVEVKEGITYLPLYMAPLL